MAIRLLPPVLVNRIAAGEVIERPAAAVKELVENAIDAGASRIDIVLKEGGQALISVADNGAGMTQEELGLAVERHCTSKLPDDDLSRISALGFRGEALPSIGAVSRMRIVSRPPDTANAWEITVAAGVKHPPAPSAYPIGTRVEVRDLFFATPARLKFLKTPRTERDLALDTVRRLAMAYPGIAFTVTGDDERVMLRLAAAAESGSAVGRRIRLATLLGRDFAENSVEIEAERGGFRLSRGAVSRIRAGARADRRRPAQRARRGWPSRVIDGRRCRSGGVPPARFTSARRERAREPAALRVSTALAVARACRNRQQLSAADRGDRDQRGTSAVGGGAARRRPGAAPRYLHPCRDGARDRTR